MNAFEQFITSVSWKFLDANGQPFAAVQPYGAFHITGFVLTIAAAVLMCVFLRNVTERTMRIILASVGTLLIVGEVYKQLVFAFDGGEWKYPWWVLPFQFCATPMYAMLLAGLLKGGKLRDGLIGYLSTFSLGAGVSVFLFLGDIYQTSFIGVCVQTTVHHGLMVAIGAWLLLWNRKRGANLNGWIWTLIAFFSFEAIALTLNTVINGVLGAGTVDLYFLAVNGGASNIPIFGFLRENLPYFAYLALYNIGFTLGAFIVYSLSLERRKRTNYTSKLS